METALTSQNNEASPLLLQLSGDVLYTLRDEEDGKRAVRQADRQRSKTGNCEQQNKPLAA